MKMKTTIMVISGILAAACLIISLKSKADSATDKWVSFGLGLFSALFFGNLIALIVNRNKAAKQH